ncbi:MAG: 50S ribosomal protein L29 [Myxococcota bacterium]
MNAKELRDLSQQELETKAAELRGELWSARVKKATGQLENSALLRKLRRDRARVETVLREKLGASQ